MYAILIKKIGDDTLSILEIIIYVLAFMSIPLFIWMIFASISVKSTYAKYSKRESAIGLTAKEVARKILDANGLYNVNIEGCKGSLTDHYDPRNNTVYLSATTIDSTSIAAIGVAAHEVGHAIQHAEGYAPIKFRSALVPIVNIASRMITPLLLLGIIFEFVAIFSFNLSGALYLAALICYGFYCLFTFVTLPCEYNASRRAKDQLSQLDILTDEEVSVTAKVLSSAAKTYLVSFLYSLAQVARILLLLLNSRRRNN